jgi:hypothetical protein
MRAPERQSGCFTFCKVDSVGVTSPGVLQTGAIRRSEVVPACGTPDHFPHGRPNGSSHTSNRSALSFQPSERIPAVFSQKSPPTRFKRSGPKRSARSASRIPKRTDFGTEYPQSAAVVRPDTAFRRVCRLNQWLCVDRISNSTCPDWLTQAGSDIPVFNRI